MISVQAQSRKAQKQAQKEFKEEILTKESPDRFSVFPIEHENLWEHKKLQEAKLWLANEIDYSADLPDWENLDSQERFFVEHILAFFATADGIVIENLLSNFAREIKVPEVIANYTVQGYIEGVHAETYGRHILTLIADPIRRRELFDAINKLPCIQKKAEWAIKWMDASKASLAERIIAYIVMEGVFFSGAFCSIFWLKSRGKMVKGLGTSNEFIARDEAMHCNLGIMVYNLVVNKLSETRVHEIFAEAVEIEKEFINEILPGKLTGMNSELMIEHIKHVANFWLFKLGFSKLFPEVSKTPFDFMIMNGMYSKANFFDKKDSNYSKSFSVTGAEDRTIPTVNDDF
jgi:ribonucleotide reductase beta subunit family protein with ferritin-like domain